MPGPHRILTSANAHLAVTNIEGTSSNATFTLDAIPLTTIDGTATGRIAVPVLAVGGTGTSSNTVQGTAADNAVSVGNPVYVGGIAVQSSTYSPAYTAGDAAALAVDKDSGGLLCHIRTLTTTDQITATPVSSSTAANTAYATNLVVKASAGRLFTLNGYNSKTSAQFIQVHNATALPSDTAVPIAVITVPASSNFSMDFGVLGLTCSTGIVVCNSSTGPTKTIGSADLFCTAVYV